MVLHPLFCPKADTLKRRFCRDRYDRDIKNSETTGGKHMEKFIINTLLAILFLALRGC